MAVTHLSDVFVGLWPGSDRFSFCSAQRKSSEKAHPASLHWCTPQNSAVRTALNANYLTVPFWLRFWIVRFPPQFKSCCVTYRSFCPGFLPKIKAVYILFLHTLSFCLVNSHAQYGMCLLVRETMLVMRHWTRFCKSALLNSLFQLTVFKKNDSAVLVCHCVLIHYEVLFLVVACSLWVWFNKFVFDTKLITNHTS